MSILNNAWMDKCWIDIQKINGTNTAYGSKTRDITVGGGDSGIDVLNVNTGQIPKLNRPEPFEIGFDNVIMLYATDWRQLKEGGTGSTQPIEVTSGTSRDQFRIVITWANTTSLASASAAITNTAARRVVIKDCYFTGLEDTWTDQLLEGNATWMVPAVDVTGSGNVLWQSNTGTGATMSTLSSYTGGNFGN